jgi:hypothetical protein
LKKIIEELIEDDKFNRRHNSRYSQFVSNLNNSMKWNILKTKNLEMNLPCTISKYILFPEAMLKTKNWSHIKETLKHEQIHILQRQYQDLFNHEYRDMLGNFISSVRKNDVNYEALNIEHIHIQNPDEDNLEWIIYDHKTHKYYIVPYLVSRESYYKNNNEVEEFKNNNSNNSNSKHFMPHVSTMVAFEVDMTKNEGPHTYTVTGQRVPVQQLEYYKYLMTLTNNKHVNIAHPNETYTDLFLL